LAATLGSRQGGWWQPVSHRATRQGAELAATKELFQRHRQAKLDYPAVEGRIAEVEPPPRL
jgi:hypothetical protein